MDDKKYLILSISIWPLNHGMIIYWNFCFLRWTMRHCMSRWLLLRQERVVKSSKTVSLPCHLWGEAPPDLIPRGVCPRTATTVNTTITTRLQNYLHLKGNQRKKSLEYAETRQMKTIHIEMLFNCKYYLCYLRIYFQALGLMVSFRLYTLKSRFWIFFSCMNNN